MCSRLALSVARIEPCSGRENAQRCGCVCMSLVPMPWLNALRLLMNDFVSLCFFRTSDIERFRLLRWPR